jgi:hypothetical protein
MTLRCLLVATTDDEDDILIINISGNIRKCRYFKAEIQHAETAGSEYFASYSYLQHVD